MLNKIKLFSRIPSVRAACAAVALGVAQSASAADGIDVAAAVATITGAIVTVSALGVAALSVVVSVKTFKWVRGAL